jgi:hypothetical protein
MQRKYCRARLTLGQRLLDWQVDVVCHIIAIRREAV